MPKTSSKRPLKIMALTLAAVVTLLLVIVGGILIWLRTSAGSGFVFNQVVKVLQGSGLTLTAGSFDGPLPGRLVVRDAVLSDQEGTLARIGLLELELKPTALISGLVQVPLLKIEDPVLVRVPVFPPKPEEEPSAPFSLPVDIRLDKLALTGGRVEAGALNPLGLNTPALALTADGLARLEGGASAVDLTARLSEEGGDDLMAAVIKLGAGERAANASVLADRLELSLKVQDRPGGLLAGILNDPDWPGLVLDLAGQGRLDDWRGQLDLAAGGLGELTADLNFQGQTGNLWHDLVEVPDWTSRVTLKAQPGSALAEDILKWTGRLVQVELQGGLTGQDLAADLKLAASGEPAVNLGAQVSGVWAEGGGDLGLSAVVNGLLPSASGADQSINLTADLKLSADDQKVENLKLTAPGFDLGGSAGRQIDGGAILAKLKLAIADGSPLVAEGLKIAGLSPEDFGGGVDLTADLDWRGVTEPASGQLRLSGRDLRWPSEELAGLLGSELELDADLSGGGAAPLTADIKEASAGQINLKGQASYLPGPTLAQSVIKADLEAGLENIGEVSPDLSGQLALALKAEGPLNDFKGEVNLSSPELTAAPGRIKDFSLKAAAAGVVLADPEAQGPVRDLSGRLELAAADSPGGPLELTTDWSYREIGAELALSLTNLLGRLTGLELKGGLSADLGSLQNSLAGDLSAEVSDWSKLAALTGQPLTGDPARLLINLGSAEGRQTAAVKLDAPRLKLGAGSETILSLNKTSLDFQADDLFGRPDLDLDLTLGSGLAGPFSWASGTAAAVGKGGVGEFEVKLNQTKLSGAKGGARDGATVLGGFDLSGETPVIKLNKLDYLIAQSGLTLKEPLTVTLGEDLKISPFSAAIRPAGQLSAEVDLTPGAMRIKADLKKLPYAFLQPFVGGEMTEGEVQSLTVALDQAGGSLAGDFALKTQAAPKQLKNLRPTLDLNGRLTGGRTPALEVEGQVSGGSGWRADGKFSGRIPMTAGAGGGFPQPDMSGPLSGNLTFNGSLAPLWALTGQPDRSLTGEARVEAKVEGSLNKPQPRGTVYLAGGRYEDSVVGILINDITLEAHSTSELPLKALLSAKDGRGGGLAFSAELRDLNNPALTAEGKLSRFSPVHRDDLIVFITGTVGAKGPLDRLAVNSDLTVDRGEMDLRLAGSVNSIPTLEISQGSERVQAASGGLDLGLKVKLPNQFFIRGYGLESEWRGDLTVGGASSRPSLVGQLAPVRGYFEFLSKEFEFTGGEIAFNGGTNPSLNLELTYNGPNITAILHITGTASKPAVSLDSRPPLPQEEILAQVLFGKSTASISRFEALQLASALQELRDFGKGGGLDALGKVRSAVGLDVLRLGGTENTRERSASSLSGSMGQEMTGASSSEAAQTDAVAVEAGKYITDNIYVGVEHSGSGGSAVRVEVELRPGMSFEARTSTESSQFGLGWKKDY